MAPLTSIFAKDGNHFARHATGQILDKSTGKPFADPGLWGLQPGTAAAGGTDAVWFSAGINGEQDGLVAYSARNTGPVSGPCLTPG